MKFQGLSPQEVEASRKQHGSNALTQLPPDPLWKKLLEGFKDPMIMILLAALVIQVILFCLGQAEWFEPVGILVAILIANGVAAVSESKQEGKASALKEEEEAKEMVKVIRSGALCEIHVSDVVVGDLVYLQAGDKLPADGTVVEGTLFVDQAALNGETEEAEKIPLEEGATYDIKDLLNKYYAYRGTVVCGGEGFLAVKVVGDKTLFGELALEVQEDTRETPLQVKLGKLAKQISTFGYVGAIAIVAGILLKTLLTGAMPSGIYAWIRLVMDAITVAVTIIVCAVPEGLPMLTSILLSFQSLRMAKDNVLVRKINGLETAGSLSLLFSDKTGTITEGKLSVVEMSTGNLAVFTDLQSIAPALAADVVTGTGVNNSAVVSNDAIIGGNSTDRALMAFLVEAQATQQINKEEVLSFHAFDSNKKSSSVTLNRDGQSVTYIKGAPEKIIERCTHYVDETGAVKALAGQDALTHYIDTQAGRSMRLLAVAKVDGPSDQGDLTLVCVISIRDNVRKEAIEAIKEVQNAGIQVVMVTGDRKETAVAIAKEAGLLTSDGDVALTSAELAEKSDEELKAILPRLRVVSRALPTDKSRLVRVAQELDYVVGMTGDGVNDSPALKKADVGFAMGSGTEVAKEAGDITILDDNFSSIEKAILYGRTMFKSIRKFLIFQLTVNVSAVLTCFIGPLLGVNVVLTVIQLLLVNLAMDTLAAIAFGSEPALREYMKDKPIPRTQGIITKEMFTQVLISAAYITVACLGILFLPAIQNLFGDVDMTYLKSAVFATFMMAITFNGFNARTSHINPFENLGRNRNFLLVMLAIFLLQFVFVTFGGDVLSVEALTPQSWLVCLILAFLVIPIDMVRKALTHRP
ncbi:MAG: calcium-translocating P-type ATPase, PMCA-type [Ruminiclostridium sp.]|jgi:Ca2+-transporting ATPase|nr:calcium-translocating P-type ATPase, PMCA-type [Ruminiclostridium sp.]MCI9466534.1 calcium-translocating P-type ATPase, PMCA-type [Ruminiclostridium sp.]